MNPQIESERSSGNVFADIGVANPEQALAKAEMARRIGKIISERSISQTEAASILGIDQPRVSALATGRLSLFSLEKMMQFLARLGNEVEISVKPSPHGSIRVVGSIPEMNGRYILSRANINGRDIDFTVAMNQPYNNQPTMRIDRSGIQPIVEDGELVAA